MLKQKYKYDLIVLGATGFTGKLVVEYLLKNYGIRNSRFTWAIAGRNKVKLEKLSKSLTNINKVTVDIDTFVVDSFDSNSLDILTSSCKVILSTVGPYLKYGLTLIKSCVKNKTNYCDITGEVPFIRDSIDKFHEEAKRNKCRIIHSCGFDSIPSDLGVLLLQKNSLKKYDTLCEEVNLYVQGINGGISGGTAASMMNIINYIKLYPNKRDMLKSPLSLNPVWNLSQTIKSL